MTGLYIHVPFCLSKCPYCDFYSVKFNKKTADEYTKAVIRNLNQYESETFDTVYFGGGTPILLWEQICEILSFLSPRIEKNAEITVEANPNSTTEYMLKDLFSTGVNRISFGIQSGVDSELISLGRKHSVNQAEKAVSTAYKAGFRNISVDLMLSIPNQTIKSLSVSLDFLASLPITHVSAYLLKVEKSTPFATANLNLPNENLTDKIYLQTVDFMEKNGFNQYEISNFAKDNFASRHNLKYWNCEEYIGIGPASHSFYRQKRFAVNNNLDEFISCDIQKTYITESNPQDFYEWAMLRLRLTKGLEFSEAESFGIKRERLLEQAKFIPEAYLKITDKSVSITPKGFLVSNSIITNLLDL